MRIDTNFSEGSFYAGWSWGSHMFDWPRHLKNTVDRGLTVDVLPQFQEELSLADENLRAMKEIRQANVKRMFPK